MVRPDTQLNSLAWVLPAASIAEIDTRFLLLLVGEPDESCQPIKNATKHTHAGQQAA